MYVKINKNTTLPNLKLEFKGLVNLAVTKKDFIVLTDVNFTSFGKDGYIYFKTIRSIDMGHVLNLPGLLRRIRYTEKGTWLDFKNDILNHHQDTVYLIKGDFYILTDVEDITLKRVNFSIKELYLEKCSILLSKYYGISEQLIDYDVLYPYVNTKIQPLQAVSIYAEKFNMVPNTKKDFMGISHLPIRENIDYFSESMIEDDSMENNEYIKRTYSYALKVKYKDSPELKALCGVTSIDIPFIGFKNYLFRHNILNIGTINQCLVVLARQNFMIHTSQKLASVGAEFINIEDLAIKFH